MSVMRISFSMVSFFATLVVVLMITVDNTSAKRGCSAFGHACFGGHGKRSEGEVMLVPGPESDQQGPGEDEQLFLGGGRDGGNDFSRTPVIRLSPFLRQWLEAYRRTYETEVRK